jgi:hypothetical protein
MRASSLATLFSALLVLSVAIPIVGTVEIVDWDDGCSLKIGVFVWEVRENPFLRTPLSQQIG